MWGAHRPSTARIHPIHEGTTGIHGLDLLGRKITLKGGKAVQFLVQEIRQTIAEAQNLSLVHLSEQLEKALDRVQKVTGYLLTLASQNIEVFLADATLYLEFFGIVTIAWQWLKQDIQAQKGLESSVSESDQNFYQGKIATAHYFFEYELVKTISLSERLTSNDHTTIIMQTEWF